MSLLRTSVAAVFLALLACGQKEETPAPSSPAPEWKAATLDEVFASYKSACARKDAPTVMRNFFSRRMQDYGKGLKDAATRDPKRMKNMLQLDRDPATMTEEELREALVSLILSQEPVSIEARDEGHATLRIRPGPPGSGRENTDQWLLIREDGQWRADELK